MAKIWPRTHSRIFNQGNISLYIYVCVCARARAHVSLYLTSWTIKLFLSCARTLLTSPASSSLLLHSGAYTVTFHTNLHLNREYFGTYGSCADYEAPKCCISWHEESYFDLRLVHFDELLKLLKSSLTLSEVFIWSWGNDGRVISGNPKLCCLLCTRTTKCLWSCWTCFRMAACLKWQLQLGSVLRIGGCQSFGSSYTFSSHWSTIASQLGVHVHTDAGVKKRRWGVGGGNSGHKGAASAVAVAQAVWKHPISLLFSWTQATTVLPEIMLRLIRLSKWPSCSRDPTPFRIAMTKSPAGAAESCRYHRRRPVARQWQIHISWQKYKALCFWAENGTADSKKNRV